MRETLDQLLALQETDTAIREAETAMAALDDGTAAASALADLEKTLEERRHALEEASANLKDRELALATVEDKKRQAEGRAYGGTISNPKELQGLEKDIEYLAHKKDGLESEVLEIYDTVEERKAAVEAQEGLVSDGRERLAQTRDQYAARLASLEQRLADLAAERVGRAAAIDAALLRQYDTIRQRAKNLGIAVADHGVCSGCNLAIPSTTLKRLNQATTIIACDSCGRILHPGRSSRAGPNPRGNWWNTSVSGKAILHVDGCSLGNPGPAGIGAVLTDDGDTCVAALGEFIGETTNNVAEYRALLRGLKEALRLGFDRIEVRTDSQLMQRQISGEYRVKMEHLKPLRADAVRELARFESAVVRSVPRESNVRADRLARRAAKLRQPVDGLSKP